MENKDKDHSKGSSFIKQECNGDEITETGKTLIAAPNEVFIKQEYSDEHNLSGKNCGSKLSSEQNKCEGKEIEQDANESSFDHVNSNLACNDFDSGSDCDITEKIKTEEEPDVIVIEDDCEYTKGKSNEDMRIFNCAECSYKTNWKSNLNQHFRVRHSSKAKVFPCSQCEFMSKYKASLANHMQLKHSNLGEVFKCSKCKYKSKSKNRLLAHEKSKHDPGREALRLMKAHESKQSSDSNCRHCRENILPLHMRVHHNEDSDVQFKCVECAFVTKCKKNLLEHVRVVHEETPGAFKCVYCPYATKWKRSLGKHVRVQHKNCVSLKS